MELEEDGVAYSSLEAGNSHTGSSAPTLARHDVHVY